ncbi:MAG: type I DNA topoisomerase, partial [Spirochaetes bacterium]|nr:type I DNA topoisomerase [Spirochaetota bacterium]
PYITSKLQQDAANRLGYTSQKTMMIAQQLYEGVEVTGEGPVGLITYMRTDSTRVSEGSIDSVRQYIAAHFPQEFLPERPNEFQNKKGAQDAHEAIRPTDVTRSPDTLKGDLTRDQYRLYDLIWRRFISSQMTPEVSELTAISLGCDEYLFRASGSTVLSMGFTAVEKESKTEKHTLPDLKQGDSADISAILPEQHFTSPPPRFTDASLVKFLEESAIGRPSTYAPTISTLIKRYYVTRSGKQLVPTVLGKLVNDIMANHFQTLVSVDFTANMEGQLDLIEDEKSDYLKMLSEFYGPFKSTVDDAEKNITEMKNILDEETDEICEKCGRKMVKKLGKYGFFVACTGFPECRNSKPITLGKCPKCEDGSIIKRSSKKGRGSFYACTNYPKCDFLTRDDPADKVCPKCSSLLFRKRMRNVGEKLICLKEGCGYHVELLDKTEEENGNS